MNFHIYKDKYFHYEILSYDNYTDQKEKYNKN